MTAKFYEVNIKNIIGRSSGLANASIAFAESGGLLVWVAGGSIVVRNVRDSCARDRYLQLPALGPVVSTDLPRTPSADGSPTPERVWGDETTTSHTSKGKGNTIVAIAVSPDGKWLACGEQGHKPRLCVFNLQKQDEDSQSPSYSFNDAHLYGIKELKFSPNSRFLVSLGYVHDGSIHVWEFCTGLGMKKLASNRVTAKLKAVVWVGNRELVSAGQRHIRIWNLRQARTCGTNDSHSSISMDAPLVLEGRSVILGKQVLSNFISVCSFASPHFLVATTDTVFLVNFLEKHDLQEIIHVEFDISFVGHDSQSLLIGATDGTLQYYEVKDSECRDFSLPFDSSRLLLKKVTRYHSGIQGYFRVHPDHFMIPFTDGSIGSFDAFSEEFTVPLVSSLCCWEDESDLLVGGSDGYLRKLSSTGLMKSSSTLHISDRSLTTMTYIGPMLLLGTAAGEIISCSTEGQSAIATIYAHDREVLKIHHNEEKSMVLSFSSDKSIQLFDYLLSPPELVLRQTFTEHTANISEAIFVGTSYLVSCSMDRTVIIRSRVLGIDDDDDAVFRPSRIVDLRAAAVSMACISDTKIVVSCLNKTLLLIDLESGTVDVSLKAQDSYEHLLIDPELGICGCVASQDRAFCIVSLETGRLLSSKRSNHIKPVTSMRWSNQSKNLIYTTSLDGLVVAWTFSLGSDANQTPVKRIYPKFMGKSTGTALKFQHANFGRKLANSPQGNHSSPRTPLSPSKLAGNNRLLKRSDSGRIAPKFPDGPDMLAALCRETVSNLKTLEASGGKISESDRLALQRATKWLLSPETT